MRSLGMRAVGIGALGAAAFVGAVAGGCGGGSTGTGTGSGGTSTSTTTTMSTGGSGGATTTTTTTTTSTTTTTGTGGATTACTTTAKGQLRGSAIALTSDDKTLITVNRDAGSVTVMSVAYTAGAQPTMTSVAEIPVGGEPWQVVIDGCDATAYVVLRKDQKVVQITGIGTSAPALGKSLAVGSEPTSLSLTPNNTKLYVSNWVDGTISVIDPVTFTMTSFIDLNGVIAATGLLGPDVMTAPRAALAHPRGVAVTNNGDSSDADETVYVTEWFAVRTKPEAAGGANADTNWKGLLYKIPVSSGTASVIDLPPVTDTTFNDAKGNVTGCFPNQVASVTLDSGFAYVTSTCASPAGPTGVFQKAQCNLDSQCTAAIGSTANGAVGSCVNGACMGSCTVDADCGGVAGATGNPPAVAGACGTGGVCKPFAANAKTSTHPGLTIVDLTAGTGTTTNLDALFANAADNASATASTRFPLLPTDVDFKPGFGYVASEGADALFRLAITNGAITKVGSATNSFIDVRTTANAAVHLPIGVVTSKDQTFAFVANDGTRDVVMVDLNAQAVSTSATADVASSALPTGTDPKLSVLNGKRFFNTGLGRWSLNGAAWGSCGACHVDGLTDNVTWYFARGPRQSTSLNGTFSKTDPTDQRVLNWTAVNDEVADFETNVRAISGGVGAIVNPNSNPPVATDRINTLLETPPQQGLQGSSVDAADPTGASAHPHSLISNWNDINNYIQTIRSPRAPTNLVADDVNKGQGVFEGAGNCIGCHSGAKWTISTAKFYTPGDVPNDAFGALGAKSLSTESWLTAAQTAKFPAALFPSSTAGKQTMRSGAPPTFEQIQCVLRPVGTIVANGATPKGVSPAAVNVQELRQDMATGAQGAGGVNANDFTVGFNTPSLLGVQVGAPYFHAGNARTLEEALTTTFVGHYQSAVAQVFDLNPATNPNATTLVKELVAYMLSIDGTTTPIAIPAVGASGGDICSYTP